MSYKQNQNNPNLGVASPEEYFSEQLRRLNMDQARAIKIWRQVLLFRRYFHDAGATALVDTLIPQNLNQYAYETATVDLYHLSPELRLANYDALQNFEIYLQATSKKNKNDPLALPQEFLSVAEVSSAHPELVQKRYELEVAQASLKGLQGRIGLRELWNWEVDDENWQTLVKQFPDLGLKTGEGRSERFEMLDNLDSVTRSKVDGFAKQAIVKAHPEWIQQALDEAQPNKIVVGLRLQGGKMPFNGLEKKEKREAFVNLLDQAPLGETSSVDSPLHNYTADNQTYYRITVLGKANESEILTFAEAQKRGNIK